MSIAHLLEDFGTASQSLVAAIEATPVDVVETVRLESYEEGYRAGWDDAIAANTAERLQLAADLSQNLRDLSFTYQEACSHVINSLSDVIDGMLGVFLPTLVREGLAPKVIEELRSLPVNADEMQINLQISEENMPIIEQISSAMTGADLNYQADSSLTAGQVVVGFDEREIVFDFDHLLTEMRSAIETFQSNNAKEQANE